MVAAIVTLALLILGGINTSQDEVEIIVPTNFSGQVRVEMGVSNTPALERDGKKYKILVPPDVKVAASTIVAEAIPRFSNSDADHVWDYMPSISKTGDGAAVGGSIESFVGTKEQYQSAEAKKHKSRLYPDVGIELPDEFTETIAVAPRYCSEFVILCP